MSEELQLSDYTLYSYWRSSASWRLRWALVLKNLKFEYVPVNLLKKENIGINHIALNPSGKIPVLVTPKGDVLTQSLPMLEYLEEIHPEVPLFPKDPIQKAHCRALCEVISSDIAPMQLPTTQARHSKDPLEKLAWTQEWVRKGLKSFDDLLEKHGLSRDFCMGNTITMADLFLIPQIYNAKRYEIDMPIEFPRLWKIYENCLATKAGLNSSPEKQIDAP